MKQILLLTALLFAVGTAAAISSACAQETPERAAAAKTVYTCPMHPDIVSGTPGTCPKCGMKLVAKDISAAAVANTVYTCPMHPDVVAEKPGTCPKCGMKLVAKDVSAAAAANTVYTCPMHPDVVSEKPGTCPKCGMKLVAKTVAAPDGGMQQTPAAKIQRARALLDEAKKQLADEGKYRCCIDNDCDHCALAEGTCACARSVKAGKPVCSDCYAGWMRGDGVVKGVDAKKVRMELPEHAH